jgi:hypothetical protein
MWYVTGQISAMPVVANIMGQTQDVCKGSARTPLHWRYEVLPKELLACQLVS